MTEPPEFPPPSPYPAHPQAYPPAPAGQPLPSYGQTPWPQPPIAPPPVSTNGFSIAALITGIVGFFLLSIPFAIVALRQIKRSRQNGRGMAVAGLVLSGLWMVGLTATGIVIGVVVNNYVDRDDNGTIVGSGWMFLDDLRVGDCMEDAATGETVWKVRGVPCADPHLGEVYAFVDLQDQELPTDESMFRACARELQTGFPGAWEDETIQVSWVSPSNASWDAGDRELVCYATTDTPRTGSITD